VIFYKRKGGITNHHLLMWEIQIVAEFRLKIALHEFQQIEQR